MDQEIPPNYGKLVSGTPLARRVGSDPSSESVVCGPCFQKAFKREGYLKQWRGIWISWSATEWPICRTLSERRGIWNRTLCEGRGSVLTRQSWPRRRSCTTTNSRRCHCGWRGSWTAGSRRWRWLCNTASNTSIIFCIKSFGFVWGNTTDREHEPIGDKPQYINCFINVVKNLGPLIFILYKSVLEGRNFQHLLQRLHGPYGRCSCWEERLCEVNCWSLFRWITHMSKVGILGNIWDFLGYSFWKGAPRRKSSA